MRRMDNNTSRGFYRPVLDENLSIRWNLEIAAWTIDAPGPDDVQNGVQPVDLFQCLFGLPLCDLIRRNRRAYILLAAGVRTTSGTVYSGTTDMQEDFAARCDCGRI